MGDGSERCWKSSERLAEIGYHLQIFEPAYCISCLTPLSLPFVFVLIVNSDLKWKISPNFSFFFSSVHCYLSFPLSLLPGAVGLALDADWQYEGENIPPFSFSVNCVFSHCASLLTPANLTEMVIVGYVCQSLYCQFLPFLLHLTLFIHLSFPRYNSAGLQNHFLSL